MAERRIRSVTAKVTDSDYKKCAAAAGKISVSEWTRRLVLRELEHIERPPIEQQLIAEFWALRYIMVNGLPALPTIDTFIKEADQKKADKARAILEGIR